MVWLGGKRKKRKKEKKRKKGLSELMSEKGKGRIETSKTESELFVCCDIFKNSDSQVSKKRRKKKKRARRKKKKGGKGRRAGEPKRNEEQKKNPKIFPASIMGFS